MSAMVKCKRVMRLTPRLRGFPRLKCGDAGLFQVSRIDPDQELSISGKSARQAMKSWDIRDAAQAVDRGGAS